MKNTFKTFGYNASEAEQKQKQDNLNIGLMTLDTLNAMLPSKQNMEKGVDAKGFPIINLDDDNAWFALNVAFVFAKGVCYDEDDDKLFTTILSCWHNDIHGRAFLINKCSIEDWKTSKILPGLEKQLYITHGNYHICLIPLVMTDADITKAPEKMFMRHGIVQAYKNWGDIEKFVSEMVSRYGLRTDPANEPKESLHPIEDFNFDMKIDVDAVNEGIDINLRRAEFDKLQRTGVVRLKNDPNKQRKLKPNLFTRMHFERPVDDTMPEYNLGVLSHGDMSRTSNFESNKNSNFTEFKLRQDDASYDYETRKNKVTAGAFTQVLPEMHFL